jgi:hypothetical protein
MSPLGGFGPDWVLCTVLWRCTGSHLGDHMWFKLILSDHLGGGVILNNYEESLELLGTKNLLYGGKSLMVYDHIKDGSII